MTQKPVVILLPASAVKSIYINFCFSYTTLISQFAFKGKQSIYYEKTIFRTSVIKLRRM